MTQESVRLAELLGGLSLACDVADGFPLEKVLRTVVLAVELGRRHGMSPDALRDVYYTTLLRYAGCTAFSHEEAHHYGAGDDIATRNVMAMADPSDPVGLVKSVLLGVGREASLLSRAQAVARLLGDGVAVKDHAHSQCEVSVRLATLVGVSEGVTSALNQICERYDGKGAPRGMSGEALALAMRVSHVADIAEIAHHRHGRESALATVRRRSGAHFDPAIVRTFVDEAPALFDAIEAGAVWETFLAAEPTPQATAAGQRLDEVARAFALFADLKSGYTLGHSPGVAARCDHAAAALDLPGEERTLLRRAALLHDLGRVGAPNRIWDKPGPLSAAEWERVRMHTYWTERILSQASALRPTANLAAAAHERMHGGGYHRGLPAPMLSRAAKILAAADAFQAMGEPRPHRPALGPDAAARALRSEIAAGRIDRVAGESVLESSGSKKGARARTSWPRGLSDREVEVLRLVARGRSNKEIGTALDISARTAQHHVIHIYQKIDVSSRAAAALFATENGLLD